MSFHYQPTRSVAPTRKYFEKGFFFSRKKNHNPKEIVSMTKRSKVQRILTIMCVQNFRRL